MGKIFPQIKTLKEKPELFEATLKLIEKAFQYKAPNSFKVDFAPLIDESNHHNCFILIDENDNVLAHIGAKEKTLSLNERKYPITLLGGIAVDESRRGEGHFQTLFNDVLAEKRADTTFFLLWSDLEKLYNKFGFHLCGTQFEFTGGLPNPLLEKTTYQALSSEEKAKIKSLYESSFAKEYLTLERSQKDWELIEKITAADLYLNRSGTGIVDYYFMNKGQDLPGVIYEYGSTIPLNQFIEEIGTHGKVWMGKELLPTEKMQYQFFLGTGDLKLFTDFIRNYTHNKIDIQNINLMKQEVYFNFNSELLALDLPDFLRGIFGPGTFEELELPTFFLSGLDSI
ncbi:MAG: GNAT family N-acetyltransferase [Bacteriovoracaceae bacterium]|nr:GNAT family N-acetyltransferase [Bacteriovoracaceae bacterium]